MILRVSREHYRTLWASLTLLRRLGGQPVIVRVTHVSGEWVPPLFSLKRERNADVLIRE